jgi:hypothetical protein
LIAAIILFGSLLQDGEEVLDGIGPEGGRWGGVEDETWMFADPFHHVRVLMGGTVIDDDMNHLRHTRGVDWLEVYENAMTEKYGPAAPIAAE